jgi:GNAT superfamily N-acetyltransferase
MTVIRHFVATDFDDLVGRWHETNLVSYPYVAEHQRHTLEDARGFFRARVVPECAIWVAEDRRGLLGLIALDTPWIRHLAVFPGYQRSGIGSALMAKAREHSPAELRAYTFRRNLPARSFYERHGFVAVAFGVSPAPESEPDVEYRWRTEVGAAALDHPGRSAYDE